jgi:hypothetical protein
MGVVQVDGWKRLEKWEGEKMGRVEFTGKLLSEHPSIHYLLKDRTVRGTILSFFSLLLGREIVITFCLKSPLSR